MKQNKMVSIITPCYNGAAYIDRYAKCLLAQDYHNCQLIFMDDGSEDGSGELIQSYRERFLEKGIYLEYYRHSNSGIAYSVGKGLLYVKGDYLIWPDIDDYMPPDSISRKVGFLENNPDYGVVRTNFKVVKEGQEDKPIGHGAHGFKGRYHEHVFEDYAGRKSAWYQPGCFMIRMEAFLRSNPDRYIYPSRAGQNIQMLFPVFYYYKCGYLEDVLYVYILHKGSMSDKAMDGYRKTMESLKSYEKIAFYTIKHMNIPDEKKYLWMNRISYTRAYLDTAFDYSKKEDAEYFYYQLKKYGVVNLKCYLKKRFAASKAVHVMADARRLVRNIQLDIYEILKKSPIKT